MRLGKDMRVPAHHLIADSAGYSGKLEESGFLSHACMEDHLEQEVTQFIAQFLIILTLDRVSDLIGFLDGVGRDATEILFDIPRAAALRVAQAPHDIEKPHEFIASSFDGGSVR